MEQIAQSVRRTVGAIEPPFLVLAEELRLCRVDSGVSQGANSVPMTGIDRFANDPQGEPPAQCINELLVRRKETVVPIHPVVELQTVQMESGRPGYSILDPVILEAELREETIARVILPGAQDVGGGEGACLFA